MVIEDFSFPRVADPHFTVLPFLWGARSAGGAGDGREDQKLRRKSFPGLGMESEWRRGGGSGDGMSDDGEGEEKMDVLWEDFNQAELQFRAESGEKAELRHLQERADGGVVVVARKRAAMVAVLKVMKKLFLLHNSVRLRKTSSLHP